MVCCGMALNVNGLWEFASYPHLQGAMSKYLLKFEGKCAAERMGLDEAFLGSDCKNRATMVK